MSYEIKLSKADAGITATIRSNVKPEDLPKFVPAACGEVWAFIRSDGLPQPGRHTALYLQTEIVEVGVEVSERFVGDDRIHCSQLPAGRVATTTHFGPYARLGDAHSEIRRWCAERGYPPSGISWEIYEHWEESWNTDPSKIRIQVFHLLEEQDAIATTLKCDNRDS